MANNQRSVRFKQGADRKKSGAAKLTNVTKHVVRLNARIKKEGETAWLKDAMKRAKLRAKKYGIKLPA